LTFVQCEVRPPLIFMRFFLIAPRLNIDPSRQKNAVIFSQEVFERFIVFSCFFSRQNQFWLAASAANGVHIRLIVSGLSSMPDDKNSWLHSDSFTI